VNLRTFINHPHGKEFNALRMHRGDHFTIISQRKQQNVKSVVFWVAIPYSFAGACRSFERVREEINLVLVTFL
jgi:hypothetical protein